MSNGRLTRFLPRDLRLFSPSINANQMRLILHTAAFWLMWRIQQAIPKATVLRTGAAVPLNRRARTSTQKPTKHSR